MFTCTVYCKECANAIEFRSKHLEYNQSKGKLSQTRSNIGSFKSALRCADLDKLLVPGGKQKFSIALDSDLRCFDLT